MLAMMRTTATQGNPTGSVGVDSFASPVVHGQLILVRGIGMVSIESRGSILTNRNSRVQVLAMRHG